MSTTKTPAVSESSSVHNQDEQDGGGGGGVSTINALSSFRSKLEARINAVDSLLCVGLDPHEKELEISSDASNEEKADAAFTFCKTLIDQTQPYACCYKPNAAFFEALGSPGLDALERIITNEILPTNIPVLLDVKRGDIGSTAAAYAKSTYDILHADAVTLSPLMGWDSVSPFVTEKYPHKGAFLLCKTSNPGSNELLGLKLSSGEAVFERIAKFVGHEWKARCTTPESSNGTGTVNSDAALLGLVVGATDPEALRRARKAGGDDVWILAPGVGAQGGDLLESLQAGLNSKGTGMLLPVSRGISRAENPSEAAKQLHEQINQVRQQVLAKAGGDAAATSGSSATSTVPIEAYQKEFLEFALEQGVLKFGSFVLKSGRTSPYFFNAGLFATGAALFKLGKAYAATIMSSSSGLIDENGNVNFDVVFGPAYKGISLGAVVSSALYSDFGVDVGFAYNRKEAKDHGEGGTLVGAPMAEKRILIVDDVITAGTAIRESYDLLKGIAAVPVGVVIALDRAEVRSLEDRVSAVQAVSRDLALKVVSIVNLPQLQTFLDGNPNYAEETLKSVAAYRQEFGV